MELGRLYVTIAADTKKLTAGLAKAKGEIQKTTAGMGKHFQTMGLAMTVAGAAITAAFGLTVKAAITEQKELAQVSTMLDDLSMKYMPEFAEGLDRLSIKFGESSATLSKGLYDILSASIEPAKALDVLEVSAKAATAGITDTGIAADAITTILNSYKLEAEDAGMVSDKLFAIVKRGKTTFAELAPAIGTVAATASMAGFSFEDLGASIATMTRAGLGTTAAMTSINGVLKAFLKPMPKAVKAAGQFGLVLNTATLKTIGLTGVMEKLKNATAEELAMIFGSIRGLKGMAAALGDAEGYALDYELMLHSAGLTQSAFEKQSQTLGFQLGRLKMAFGVIAEEIGTHLIPIIEKVVNWMMKAALAVVKFMKAHPGLTKVITILGAALGVLIGAGGILVLGIMAFAKFKTALLALKGAFIAVKTALLLFTGPVGWIIAAVSALVLAWITNFGGIRDFTIAVANKVKEALGWIWDKVKWVLEKLGLYREKLAEGGETEDAFIEKQKEMADSMDDTGDSAGELGEDVEKMGDQIETTGGQLDVLKDKVETFDEWIQRLADEAAEANKKMAEAAEEAYGKYADAMLPIEERLYELSHTEEEVAAQALALQREKAENAIKNAELSADAEKEELSKVREWYEKEIGLIIAKLEEQKQAQIEVAKNTDQTANEQIASIRGITNEWDELISKIDMYSIALKKIAEAEMLKVLEETPTIAETGYKPEYIPEGTEGFQKGTPFVRRTGYVKVHRGEAIFPEKANPFNRLASSNIFNNQRTTESNVYSPNITVIVQGDGDPWAIKGAVKEGLDESADQFDRRGSWVMPGG